MFNSARKGAMMTTHLYRSALRFPCFLLLTTLVLMNAACGKSGGKKTYPVHGKVSYKGEAAHGAIVIFHPKNDNAVDAVRPTGTVDENGDFALTSYKEGDGAPAGAYYVLIRWPDTDAPRPKGKAAKFNRGVPEDFLKGRYQDHKKPKFEVEVKPETNNLSPFELKD
jgi:hypothetical protein